MPSSNFFSVGIVAPDATFCGVHIADEVEEGARVAPYAAVRYNCTIYCKDSDKSGGENETRWHCATRSDVAAGSRRMGGSAGGEDGWSAGSGSVFNALSRESYTGSETLVESYIESEM